MARQDAGSRRRGRGDSDEDYEGDSAADRAAGRGAEGGGGGGGAAARLQSSPHIGVTKYKRTGRWEAHIWQSRGSAPGSLKKGRQVHLGSFNDGDRAAQAYDMAAIALKGMDKATTNFPKERYVHEPFMQANKHLDWESFVLNLRKWAQLDSQPGYTAPVTGPGQVELLSAPGADDVFGQQQQRRPLVRARRHASAGSAQAFGQLMDESHTGASYDDSAPSPNANLSPAVAAANAAAAAATKYATPAPQPFGHGLGRLPGHDSLESDATLYGQHAGTALVGSLLLPHAHDMQAQHSGLRAAAAAGWDPRTHSLQALLHQAAPAAGPHWETPPGLHAGEAWTGGRPQAAGAQHHQSHDGGYIIHSSAAPAGELLLTDPSLLPQRSLQAQFCAPRSPDAGSYYRQDLPGGLGAYQDAEAPITLGSAGLPVTWAHHASTASPRKRAAVGAHSPQSEGQARLLSRGAGYMSQPHLHGASAEAHPQLYSSLLPGRRSAEEGGGLRRGITAPSQPPRLRTGLLPLHRHASAPVSTLDPQESHTPQSCRAADAEYAGHTDERAGQGFGHRFEEQDAQLGDPQRTLTRHAEAMLHAQEAGGGSRALQRTALARPDLPKVAGGLPPGMAPSQLSPNQLAYANAQAMLLEQGYGQQLLGHLQPAPLLQRAPFMPPLGRSGGTDQLSPRSTRAQQQPPPQRSVRSVYTQTPLEHMGSFEDEPGMSQAHEGDAAAVTTVAFREQSASPSALLHNPMLPGGAEPGAQYQM